MRIRSWRESDHAVRRQLVDLFGRHPEQLAEHVVIVFPITWRAAIDAAANVRGAFAHLDRHFGNRPASDFGTRYLGEPFERRQLRIGLAAVTRGLAYTR